MNGLAPACYFSCLLRFDFYTPQGQPAGIAYQCELFVAAGGRAGKLVSYLVGQLMFIPGGLVAEALITEIATSGKLIRAYLPQVFTI
jgi:hypothetical protein